MPLMACSLSISTSAWSLDCSQTLTLHSKTSDTYLPKKELKGHSPPTSRIGFGNNLEGTPFNASDFLHAHGHVAHKLEVARPLSTTRRASSPLPPLGWSGARLTGAPTSALRFHHLCLRRTPQALGPAFTEPHTLGHHMAAGARCDA